MTSNVLKEEQRIFRAYVWCSHNQGKMYLEFGPKDTVRELFAVLHEKWGVKIPGKSLERWHGNPGWNVIAKGLNGTGVYQEKCPSVQKCHL